MVRRSLLLDETVDVVEALPELHDLLSLERRIAARRTLRARVAELRRGRWDAIADAEHDPRRRRLPDPRRRAHPLRDRRPPHVGRAARPGRRPAPLPRPVRGGRALQHLLPRDLRRPHGRARRPPRPRRRARPRADPGAHHLRRPPLRLPLPPARDRPVAVRRDAHPGDAQLPRRAVGRDDARRHRPARVPLPRDARAAARRAPPERDERDGAAVGARRPSSAAPTAAGSSAGPWSRSSPR